MIHQQWTRVQLVGKNMKYAGQFGLVIQTSVVKSGQLMTQVLLENGGPPTDCNPNNLVKSPDGYSVQVLPATLNKSAKVIVTRDKDGVELVEDFYATQWVNLGALIQSLKV